MYFRQILHEDLSCASYIVGCVTYAPCVTMDPQGDPSSFASSRPRHIKVTSAPMTFTRFTVLSDTLRWHT
jgi:hypothetical protein